jgi:hypothetical protein
LVIRRHALNQPTTIDGVVCTLTAPRPPRQPLGDRRGETDLFFKQVGGRTPKAGGGC